MDIPVVLLHRSEQAYVSYALRSAKAHNKKVVIITDVASEQYAKHAEVEDINAYRSSRAEKFSAAYKHLSTNSFAFEYGCIERWFIILEYMVRNQLEKIIYIDSDVLAYTDLTPVINSYFGQTDFCLCVPRQDHTDFLWSASGHISYWSRNALEFFCGFVLQTYSSDMATLEKKWNWHKQNGMPGGICDMTLLYLFQRSAALQCGNFLSVTDNKYCFDNMMGSSRNEYPAEYEMGHSLLLGHDIKKMVFSNHLPFCKNIITNSDIQFWCLHFQGDAKTIMPFYIRDNINTPEYLQDLFARTKVRYWAVRRFLSGKKG